MILKKKQQEEQKRTLEIKQLKEKVERQRENAGVAERGKDDVIPGVEFKGEDVNPEFTYSTWAAELDPVCREAMDALLKHKGLETFALRDLGRKETISALKEVCNHKTVRTALRKSILELYSKINKRRSTIIQKKEAKKRDDHFERDLQDANSRAEQKKRQHDILEAFASNRKGKGNMFKHKTPKKLPKLFS